MTTTTPATTPATASQTVDRTGYALLVLRVVIGLVFLAHGYQKFFVYTLPGTTGAFTQMGAPLPSLTAPLVAAIELLGGLALILGFGTRIASVLLAVDMLAALALVHLKAGFYAPNGVEYPLTLLASTVALALAGAGAYALDNVVRSRRN